MQGYYNYIPFYQVGGKFVAKKLTELGARKLQNFANLYSKKAPELSKLLSKAAKSQKGTGPSLTREESRKLITLTQDFRRKEPNYLNRRIKHNNKIADRQSNTDTNQTNQSVINRIRSKIARVIAPNENSSAQTATQEAGQINAQQVRQNKFIGWVKKHPYISSGIGLTAFTGPGRWAFEYTQMSPEDWGKDKSQEYIEINGEKYPIKRSIGGTPEVNQQSNYPKDDIDQAIDNAASDLNNNQNTANQNAGNYQNYYQDQDSINNLFSSDQW